MVAPSWQQNVIDGAASHTSQHNAPLVIAYCIFLGALLQRQVAGQAEHGKKARNWERRITLRWL